MQGVPDFEPLRTRIYIDGYNFYYGCLKGTSYKWLDLLSLFEKHLLPSVLVKDTNNLVRQSALLACPSIKFFTAKIIETVARAPDSVSSQARYHTALRKLYGNRIDLVEGYYAVNKMKVKVVDASHPNRAPRECEEIQAWKVEEKQSDVNLSLQAYHDAMTGEIDHAVFVTNDTDIAPALQMIRSYTPVRVGVVIPTTNHERIPNTELAESAHWVRTHITRAELAACQLPRVIPGRKATVKPESWYPRPDLLHQVLKLAIPIRGDRGKAFKWMEQPNSHLDGQRPIELVETEEGTQQVLSYIQDWIAHQTKLQDSV
ncbi:antitoxin Xre/MbcA/ParS toxin-binding domain-containing protein [Pseudomonas sp. Q12-87]|uniref:antitoxin Xre/MbcA/ParS toxin-binding domain-containing protein n=1 Tax=Pseudomonas sp. Q12-87 TaxID=177989 RepID=UPI00069FD20E|nr:antitoxin Xre/MbcA/ParS toxin-binding domain-containing protein [Pseudomonas sp. Q12-87]